MASPSLGDYEADSSRKKPAAGVPEPDLEDAGGATVARTAGPPTDFAKGFLFKKDTRSRSPGETRPLGQTPAWGSGASRLPGGEGPGPAFSSASQPKLTDFPRERGEILRFSLEPWCDSLNGVRQFECAGKLSGGTGSRRLTNASGNKQATGRKQRKLIKGKNWDKGLKRKDQSCCSCGQSNGLFCRPSSLVHAKRLVEPDATINTRFKVPWPDTRVRHPCKRRSTYGCCGCPTAGPPRARPGRPASRLRRFRADPPDSGPRRRSGSP